ncbi:MAG: DUF423 domain-containing protein [Cytophagales bacterium]|nr:DUF423 domain-containing protein [Cytophagales bacterium]
MTPRNTLILGMMLMALGIGLGAFGAHALKETLELSGRKETFELGIRYLLYHALGFILLGRLMESYSKLRIAVLFLTVGIAVFSGSLVTLALTNQSLWGAVAPLGGSTLIAGWLLAAWVVYTQEK